MRRGTASGRPAPDDLVDAALRRTDLAHATNHYATGLVAVVPDIDSFDTYRLLATPGHLDTTISAVAPSVFLSAAAPEAEAKALLDTERSLVPLIRRLDNRRRRWRHR